LEEVFKKEFPNAKIQRCQVHVAWQVLPKVSQKLKEPIAHGLRSIFYASSGGEGPRVFGELKSRWEGELPKFFHKTSRDKENINRYPPSMDLRSYGAIVYVWLLTPSALPATSTEKYFNVVVVAITIGPV
jgi:transposase-like protein